MTRLRCGLIGSHISQTRLPAALGIMCEAAGMTLDFTPIDTAADPGFDFNATAAALRRDGWTGVTVTHPYKPAAAAFAGDGMDRPVRKLSASNLLMFGTETRGYNTDYLGFIAAWQAVFKNRGPGDVAVAGAGGVARAIVPALIRLGARRIKVWDVDHEAAKTLAKLGGRTVKAIPIEDAPRIIEKSTGLVNATALGMGKSTASAIDLDLIGPQWWAFDAVYTPTDTPFLQEAAAKGLATMTGFDLFRFMALETFRIYTGHTPDKSAILPALDALRPRE